MFSKYRAVVKNSIGKPTTKKDKNCFASSFAPQKYKEMARLLDIREGDLLVVPKLNENGNEDGLVLARAASARRSLGPSRNCYWFDGKKRKPPAPREDYRHVIAVDPSTVRVVPNNHSKLTAKIAEGLKLLEAPVVHSVKDALNQRLEQLYLEKAPPPGIYKPKSPAAGTEKAEREKLKADIARRRGQAAFRQKLLDAYERRCAISGCDAQDRLEAAHIRTYKGADDHDVRNGILLRADLHTLFDLGLICIQTSAWKVIVAPRLRKTTYGSLHGKRLKKLPADEKIWPKEALDYHRRELFGT